MVSFFLLLFFWSELSVPRRKKVMIFLFSKDKGNPIMSANASIIQEDEKLYSPEIVESIQSAQAVESNQVLRETWVRQDLEKTPSQVGVLD